MQFSGPAPVRLFPPPETGEGQGGGEGRWQAQAVHLPPHPNLPPPGGKGSKAQGGEEKIENCMTLKSRGALRRRVLGDETLDIGAPINFSGASLAKLRDKEDLPGDFVRR